MDLVENGGYKSEVCAKCGATRRLCYPNPHTWGEFIYVDEDTHTATCEKCGIEKTFDHRFGDAIPEVHNTLTCLDCGADVYTENSHAAVDGNEDGKCDVCLGDLTCSHTYDEGEVITPATCMTPGEIKLTCTKCGDVKVESIIPTGHAWADWESNGDGTHSRVCANNDTHTETDDCVGEDATCLGDSNCTICGGIYQTAPDHTDEDQDGVCDDCETEVDDDPNYRGDDDCEHLNETVVTIPATCLAPGSIEHTCPDCGSVRIQPIEPLAHSWTDWESNGDGTHSRVCINGDTHAETKDCVGEDVT
ncbi:MAG: hypothetical protein J6V77_03265, partial [Clostridia bacterium]|nr:hypothetical protein [Clostridia bacterium]